MANFRADVERQQLASRAQNLAEEVDRLRKCKDISESIVRLPQVCIDDIKNEGDIRKAKETALGEALKKTRGKDYDNLLDEIETIEDKSKRAYVRLYEKCGEEIGLNFLEKLDYLDYKARHGTSEADKIIESSHGKYSSAQVELKRLQDEKKRIQ